MPNNYTKLKNNYMYGHKNRLNNYYQNYKNFSNDLDDPIYTGFTFSIDYLNSPLFQSGDNLSYFSAIKNQGNDDEGISIDSGDLAEMIDKRLAEYVKEDRRSGNNYKVNPIIIPKFKGERKIGYGNQSVIFSDGFTYGAIDYIYMVDKIFGVRNESVDNSGGLQNSTSHGQPQMGFNGETNGTYTGQVQTDESSSSTTDQKNKNDEKLVNQAKSEAETDIREKLEEKETEKEKERSENSDYYDNYSDAKSNLDENEKELKEIESELEELKTACDLYDELMDVITRAKTCITQFMIEAVNGGSYDGAIKDESLRIGEDYERIMIAGGSALNVQSGTSMIDPTVDKPRIASITHISAEDIQDSFLREDICKNMYKVITCSYTSLEELDNKTLEKYQEKYDKTVLLYGKEDDGNPRNPSNSSPTSLYGQYNDTKNKMSDVKNSPASNECAKLREDLDNITSDDKNENVSESNNESNNVLNNNINIDDLGKYPEEMNTTIDNGTTTQESFTSSPGEAPQTCLDMLSFINGMKKITENYPYIFQSITGLDEAYKNYFKNDDPFMGSKDNNITISCYESIDMKVSSMFNKYFNAVYDRQFRRERVPINLRRFECSVFVHDIRNFRHALNLLYKNGKFGEDNDSPNSEIIELALNHLSVVEFKFFDCEIIPEETGNIFDTVGNAELGEQRMTSFTFKYGHCHINFLPFEDLVTYYSTNGKSDDLGNERNITKPSFVNSGNSRNKGVALGNEQVSSFIENEEIINSSNESLKKPYITKEDIKEDGVLGTNTKENGIYHTNDNVIYENIDDIGVYESYDNVNFDDLYERKMLLENLDGLYPNEEINIARLDNKLFTIGPTYFNFKDEVSYIGNVEDDDYFERSRFMTDYDTFHHDRFMRNTNEVLSDINSNRLYNENRRALMTAIRGLSASTGYPVDEIVSKLNLGNVYEKYNRTYEDFESTNTQDNENHTNLENVYKNEDINPKEETVDVEKVFENIEEGETVGGIGRLFNQFGPNGINTNLGNRNDLPDDLLNETVMNKLRETNEILFGNDFKNGINDKYYGTSTTDYVEGNVDEIGKVEEIIKEGDIIEKIEGTKYESIQIGQTGKIGNVIKDKITESEFNEIGNAYSKEIIQHENDEVEQIEMNSKEIGMPESGNVYKDLPKEGYKYKSNEKVYGTVNEYGITNNIGTVEMKSTEMGEPNLESLDNGTTTSDKVLNIGKVFNKVNESVDDTVLSNVYEGEDIVGFRKYESNESVYGEIKSEGKVGEIGKVEYGKIKEEKNNELNQKVIDNNIQPKGKYSDVGSVNQNQKYMGDTNEIGKVEQKSKFIGTPTDNGNVYNETLEPSGKYSSKENVYGDDESKTPKEFESSQHYDKLNDSKDKYESERNGEFNYSEIKDDYKEKVGGYENIKPNGEYSSNEFVDGYLGDTKGRRVKSIGDVYKDQRPSGIYSSLGNVYGKIDNPDETIKSLGGVYKENSISEEKEVDSNELGKLNDVTL